MTTQNIAVRCRYEERGSSSRSSPISPPGDRRIRLLERDVGLVRRIYAVPWLRQGFEGSEDDP